LQPDGTGRSRRIKPQADGRAVSHCKTNAFDMYAGHVVEVATPEAGAFGVDCLIITDVELPCGC